jgi:predicted NBD/HSP70 family sugar kinase
MPAGCRVNTYTAKRGAGAQLANCIVTHGGGEMQARVQSGDTVQRFDGVRRSNLAVVARIIDRLGVASQTAIVKETGLANGVAAGILAQLREIGFTASASSESTGSAGRPRRGVRVAHEFAFAVGVEVSVESVTLRICGADGSELATSYERQNKPVAESPRAMALDVFARYNELVRSSGLPDVPVSMTISVPGLVSAQHLRVLPFGWTDGSVEDFVRAAPLSVRHLSVLNDGDAAVVAEAALRPDLECVAAMYGSDGVGGGISLHGRLFSGAGGAAGQFGHIIVEQNGRDCYCGNKGCIRQYISTSAFAQDLDEEHLLASLGFRGYALALAERAAGGDVKVQQILDAARVRLAQVVGILGAALSPDVVVLTGNLAPLAPWLESSPTSRVTAQEYRAQWARPVVGSTLGQDSAITGAALVARSEILNDPMAFASA